LSSLLEAKFEIEILLQLTAIKSWHSVARQQVVAQKEPCSKCGNNFRGERKNRTSNPMFIIRIDRVTRTEREVMQRIARDQWEIFSIIETVSESSGELRGNLPKWNPWLCLCACILVLMGIVQSQPSFAQTPHSQAPSCNGPGQAACPTSTPIITPWIYVPNYPFLSTPPNSPFNGIDEINAWFSAKYTSTGWCTMDYQNTSIGAPSSTQFGMATHYYISTNYLGTEPSSGTPLCGYTFAHSEWIDMLRSIYCPAPFTATYQSSPLVGPYCTLPPGAPNPLKQIGSCPICSGVTVKGDPVNVSNGNNYQTETDYAGAGANPIKFSRAYNSLTNYVLQFYTSPRPAASAIMGEAWSATYFQFLLPLSVTDGTATYNAVYAYRPDGRVVTFNEYSGVYSPDGDVADRLVTLTGGGWQYQAADDSIETYDSNGQLVSIAARGRAPLSISRPHAFDPPSSVSDAFGHTLTFGYAFDSTNVQRLSTITDATGHVIDYAYDGGGNLATVTYPDSSTRNYAYNGTNGGRHTLLTLTDEANAAYASWTYSGWGNQVLGFHHAGGVEAYSFSYTTNSGGAITSAMVTDPFGQSRTYGQQLIWGASRTTTASSPCPGCGDDQARVLDANGNITSRTDFNSNVTTYAYDTTNNLETSRTEAYGPPVPM